MCRLGAGYRRPFSLRFIGLPSRIPQNPSSGCPAPGRLAGRGEAGGGRVGDDRALGVDGNELAGQALGRAASIVVSHETLLSEMCHRPLWWVRMVQFQGTLLRGRCPDSRLS